MLSHCDFLGTLVSSFVGISSLIDRFAQLDSSPNAWPESGVSVQVNSLDPAEVRLLRHDARMREYECAFRPTASPPLL